MQQLQPKYKMMRLTETACYIETRTTRPKLRMQLKSNEQVGIQHNAKQ